MVVVKAIAIDLGPTATYLVYALASCVALRKSVTLSLVLALTQDTRDFFSRSAKIHLRELRDGLTDARRSGLSRSHPNRSRVNLPQPFRQSTNHTILLTRRSPRRSALATLQCSSDIASDR